MKSLMENSGHKKREPLPKLPHFVPNWLGSKLNHRLKYSPVFVLLI